MSDDLVLTPEEITQGLIDGRRSKLREKLDFESAQGILPFTNERLFEQSNPIVRSALFSAGKMSVEPATSYITEWTEIFSLGGGTIHYRGPQLTVDHEIVLVKLMVLARGRSLTKPIHAFQADVLRWLDLHLNSGANYKKARRILDDLAAAELRISSKPALSRLLKILTSPDLSNVPDGAFFQQYVKNTFGPQLKMIAAGLENDQMVDVSMKFITKQTYNSTTKRMLINLDPISAIFFDGVNTTLLPFEIWDKLDRLGKKLLSMIASHRDGVWPMMLEKYHEFSGSKSEYEKVRRRYKTQMKSRFIEWEAKGYILPGWKIEKNMDGAEVVSGLKAGDVIRIKSALELPLSLSLQGVDAFGDEDEAQDRLDDFADSAGMPRQNLRKKKQANPSTP